MIISRGLTAVRTLKNIQTNSLQAVRNSSHAWNYRCAAPAPDKKLIYLAEFVQGTAWWWVLWHLWTEPGHILGEFEYPDPHKWTDEELGIPPC